MKITSTGLIDLRSGDQGPMCPQSMPPVVHPSHHLAGTFADAAYEATPRGEDGEPLTGDLAAVNQAVSYGPTTENRMRLYRAAVAAQSSSGRDVGVEALYFRCQICGFVLPASRVPELR